MAEKESSDEISASSTEPMRWPDPSRPIINERPPSQGWSGYPQPGYLPQGRPLRRDRLSSERRWRRRATATALVILVLILVAVWLLWWR